MADTDHSSSYKNLAFRRMSRVPSLVPSAHDSSDTGTTRHRLKPIYLPSYRLGPEKNQLFNVGLAQRTMKQMMESYLASETYNPKTIPNLTKTLSENIKKKLRDEAVRSPRYKLLVFVAIAQNQRQGITFATRCIWSEEYDTYAEASFQNASLYAVATAFAVYHD